MFFDSLLLKLQTVFQFKLEDYMDGMAIRAKPLRKTVNISNSNVYSVYPSSPYLIKKKIWFSVQQYSVFDWLLLTNNILKKVQCNTVNK